jgi:hypothetical protein
MEAAQKGCDSLRANTRRPMDASIVSQSQAPKRTASLFLMPPRTPPPPLAPVPITQSVHFLHRDTCGAPLGGGDQADSVLCVPVDLCVEQHIDSVSLRVQARGHKVPIAHPLAVVHTATSCERAWSRAQHKDEEPSTKVLSKHTRAPLATPNWTNILRSSSPRKKVDEIVGHEGAELRTKTNKTNKTQKKSLHTNIDSKKPSAQLVITSRALKKKKQQDK